VAAFGSLTLVPLAFGEVAGTRLTGETPVLRRSLFFVPFVIFVVRLIRPPVKTLLPRFSAPFDTPTPLR
jgi:hypothetical protein